MNDTTTTTTTTTAADNARKRERYLRSADHYVDQRAARQRALLFAGPTVRRQVVAHEIGLLTRKIAQCYAAAYELEAWEPTERERDEGWWARLASAAALAELETRREREAERRAA